MERNPLVVSKAQLLLIIDRDYVLGESLASDLEGVGTVVFVTKEKVEGSGAIFVPFSQPVPRIPEGVYSRIVFIWDEQSKHILEPIAKKIGEWQAHLYVILTKENEETIEYAKSLGATVFVLGDMFGSPKKQPLDQFLEAAKATKRIKLSGMGLHAWHPILFSDVVKKITDEVRMSMKRVGRSFFIGPPHQMTALGIAHLLQKVDPDILIDFSGVEESRLQHRLTSIFDAYNAGLKLKEYFQTLRVHTKENSKKEAEIVFTRLPQIKKKKGKGSYIVYMLIVFFLLPFVLLVGGGGLGMLFLSSGIQDAQKGQLLSAKQKLDAAVISFGTAKQASDMISVVNSTVFRNNAFESIRKQIAIGNQLTIAVDEMMVAGAKLSDILKGKAINPIGDVENVVSSIKEASIALSTISDKDVPQPFRETVQKVKMLSITTSSVVDELPQLLGIGSQKEYLVLFQNNMELRPGGGFIGSYGLLTLQNGEVKSFTIHDVYDADGQLKGHIEPPFAIRRYIPIVHLYLRDSNFDGDFTNNAKTAAYILSQETGDKVDGVVGVDLDVMRGILASVGSVYIPSYNQTVTEANFFQLLEEHSEKNFFPGSTQKKDFLNAFSTALIAKMQHGLSGRILLSRMIDVLSQKHIAFGFADPTLQQPFTLADLSGSLLDTRASQSGVLNDFFGTIEANLGINKTNAFVSRKVSQEVSIKDNGDVYETVTTYLSNNSDGTWPGGPYKNYIRFVLPKNAQVTGIALDDVDQTIVDAVTDPKVYESKSFTPPRGLEITKESEAGKILYGFLMTVPVKATTAVRISYIIPAAFTADSLENSYSLFLWKQMGIENYPYQLQVTIPDSFKLLSSSIALKQNGQVITYRGNVAGDMLLTFSLSKK